MRYFRWYFKYFKWKQTLWRKSLDAIFERNGLSTRFIDCILFSLRLASCRWTEKSMSGISQNFNAWNYLWKVYQFHKAVVAERLRRLTWNQIPSGSAGSNPASCDWIWFYKGTGCLMWNNSSIEENRDTVKQAHRNDLYSLCSRAGFKF